MRVGRPVVRTAPFCEGARDDRRATCRAAARRDALRLLSRRRGVCPRDPAPALRRHRDRATRDADELAKCDLRVDVGRKYDPETGDFDHHLGDAGERENGIRYASFGLVWKQFGASVCGSEAIADELDLSLVAPVDAGDNGQELCEPRFDGVGPYQLGRLISGFGSAWDDEDREAAEQQGFGEALMLADGIIRREIRQAQARARATGLVRTAIAKAEDPRIIEFDRGLPWKSVVMAEAPEALIVVTRVRRTGACRRCRPTTARSRTAATSGGLGRPRGP